MERNFDGLKDVLWQQFEKAVEKAKDMDKYNSEYYNEKLRKMSWKAEKNVITLGEMLLKAEIEARVRAESGKDSRRLSKSISNS
jgi:hypothetical protein